MTLPFVTYNGTVYRGHNPTWVLDPESGEGARRFGGRFNPPGMPCLYTSQTPKTAWQEAQQGFAFKAQPLTLCAYRVDCRNILDLTSPSVREATNVRMEDLACAWEVTATERGKPPSWEVAERLMDAACAGIIAPSFARGADDSDVNVVFWKRSQRRPYLVKVVDDHGRLPSGSA